jgi:transposase
MLGRSSHLERVGRWLARREQEMQVRLPRELLARSRSLNRTIAELDQELEQRAAEIAPALLDLPGCAAVTAAKLLAEIGPVDRFRSDAQLARHRGVAPLEANSGRVQRHRLDRGGNRQLNAALYRIAITQARYHPPARAYLERKRAEDKSRREAIRCLKRRLQHTQSEPSLDIGATLARPKRRRATTPDPQLRSCRLRALDRSRLRRLGRSHRELRRAPTSSPRSARRAR